LGECPFETRRHAALDETKRSPAPGLARGSPTHREKADCGAYHLTPVFHRETLRHRIKQRSTRNRELDHDDLAGFRCRQRKNPFSFSQIAASAPAI
jgi:hypothetical protein